MVGLDDIDKKILKAFQKNSRTTTKELSVDLKLSSTPIYERIKRLEREGYIKDYVALLDRDKIGKPMLAYCNVLLKEHAKPFLEKFEKDVVKFSEVVECYYTTGNYSIFVKLLCKSTDHLMAILNENIQPIQGVQRTETIISLQQPINRQIQP